MLPTPGVKPRSRTSSRPSAGPGPRGRRGRRRCGRRTGRASRKRSPRVRSQVWKRTRPRASPAIAYSIEARRVRPPGRRVRPSKVWLAVARPAGATRSEDGTGSRSRIPPSAGVAAYGRLGLGGDQPGAVPVDDRGPRCRARRRSRRRAGRRASAGGSSRRGRRGRSGPPGRRANRHGRPRARRSCRRRCPGTSSCRARRRSGRRRRRANRRGQHGSRRADPAAVSEWAAGEPAVAGPAAVTVVAAARAAVTVASTVLRRMRVTVGRAVTHGRPAVKRSARGQILVDRPWRRPGWSRCRSSWCCCPGEDRDHVVVAAAR